MGDTKETKFLRGLKIARIVIAALTGLFFFVALSQIVFFNSIKISFQTGVDAQQISTIKIKKGSDVELPTPLKPGSYFLGWSLSPTSGEVLENSAELMKDTTLYAVWDGAEKYAVLSVNGIPYKEVNIFDTSVEGLTPTQLNDDWRVLDDYATDNPKRTNQYDYRKKVWVDPNNNFSRFLGWRYLNVYGLYNDLLYEVDASGTAGTWTWVQRDADGNESRSVISDTNKFYPPNYRTTFTALLDYRTVYLQFYDQIYNTQKEKYEYASTSYNMMVVKLGAEGVTLPAYNGNNPDAHFSHWEIKIDNFNTLYANEKDKPALAELVKQVKRRYAAGEVLSTLDPLWYYLGSSLIAPNSTANDLVVTLQLRAVYWDDKDFYHYSIQPFTDTDSGSEYHNFANVKYNDLSLENPVAYENSENDNCLWLYFDNRILSYSFYDHKGVYHELKTADLKTTTPIGIGRTATVLEDEIYFREDWAINIAVNYQTSVADVTVKFNYGEDLYLLPGYRHYTTPSVTTYIRKIGNKLVMLTGENYMKSDYIFTGWQMVGDESERLYCAGETFTIPNFDSSRQQATIEFVAVWHLQRLLYDFDFMGGAWATDDGPDFTLMKGAYGERVRIVTDVPVKFGYDFVGWTLEKETYSSEDELWHPGEYINVGTKIQTLYAQWKPRRLRVVFSYKRDATDQVYTFNVKTEDSANQTLYSGGEIDLPVLLDNNEYYTFDGWEIGDQVMNPNDGDNKIQSVVLTTQILSHPNIKTENLLGNDGSAILEVHIYAKQFRRTVDIVYDLTYEGTDIKINSNQLNDKLPQGNLFYDYYPFSVKKEQGSYAIFDTAGRQLTGWSYRVPGSNNWVAIEANTKIPAGYDQITIQANFSGVKRITLEYYDFAGSLYYVDHQTRNYNGSFTLLGLNNLGTTLPAEDARLGKFVGWALEPDYAEGNPDIIYDVYYNTSPSLKLLNVVDTASSPYSVDVDSYAVQTSGLDYTLKLYAVYASNYATITYRYLRDSTTGKNNTVLECPVYSNGKYDQTVIGGSTVGYDATKPDDFVQYGMAVLDDRGLETYPRQNFIGWQITLSDGVSSAVKNYFKNKLWFPGEYLPSVDFNFTLEPIRVTQSNKVQEVVIGNRTYHIMSLSSARNKLTINESVDIVALPRSETAYTVKQGNLVINSDREVHVVVPAYGQITLEPRAIQCDTIKEFYVGENVIITGSPVVGANFQTYLVQKGYRLMDKTGKPTDVVAASEKYDYTASLSGLLISQDKKTLYGVPSHTQLSTQDLFDILVNDYQILHITEYALSDINTLSTINLAKNLDIQIDANAIFNVTAKHIILPTNKDPNLNPNVRVSPQVLSGALCNLTTVTFGDGNTESVETNYAFVEGGFVYYVDDKTALKAKTHVMYVLPSAPLKNLNFITRNLRFADTVTVIEPYALAGRDWTQINSIRAENVAVDLTNLQGIPGDIPLFTSANNPHKAPMVQPYYKTFVFTCRDSDTEVNRYELMYEYGQTFTVFDAQKNNHNIRFDKTWSQFVGWIHNNKLFKVGEVYKVGISDAIIGDKYTLYFDASTSSSWTSYLVRFYIYNGQSEVPYTPDVFYDDNGIAYTIDELLANRLGNIYLPGLDKGFTDANGSIYQFIGWGTNPTNPSSPNMHMWNNVAVDCRILPNKTSSATLNAGIGIREGTTNIYSYYALYEKVTPNLKYDLLDNQTFAIKAGFTNANVTSLNIPFAVYHEGYMLPVSRIDDGVFSNITANNTALTEIVIGGAVSEIGSGAFNGVNAKKITFAQQGSSIYYNYHQTTPARQLTIGDNAFAGNQALQSLVLPIALETLGDGAFQTCTKLENVKFDNGTPALRNLGNFVFRDNSSMTDNAVISLLTADGKNGVNRFVDVGAGIFMNTKINNLRTSDGQPTNKIVWRDTLLYVCYINGGDNDLVFTEKVIAGYAFVNAGNDNNSIMEMSIRFTNPNVKIKANAFTNLHVNISSIYLIGGSTPVRPENVALTAFDKTAKRTVTVYVSNLPTWNAADFHDIKDSFVFQQSIY